MARFAVFRPARARFVGHRRMLRIVVVTIVMAMLSFAAMGTASADELALKPVPQVARFGAWAASLFAGTPFFGNVPAQGGGSAAGRRHDASTADTAAGGGTGRPQGKAKAELPPDTPRARAVTPGASGSPVRGFDEKTSTRDPKKSSETVTAYANTDGSQTRRLSQTAVNFKDTAGAWQPIDTRVTPGADGRLHEAANSRKVDFAASAADPALATFAVDATHSLSYGLQGAAPVAAAVSGSTLTYAGALPGADVVLSPTPTGSRNRSS